MPASLLSIAKVLPLLLLLTAPLPQTEGRTLRVQNRRFSFSITEPPGWLIDFRSAAQIANFVMHPRETTWREAPIVAFARFVPRGHTETLENFEEKALGEFKESCPFFEIQDADLEIKGSHRFLARLLDCPGVRQEIIATTALPNHFATFVLSSNGGGRLATARFAFRDLLSSFRWLGTGASDTKGGINKN